VFTRRHGRNPVEAREKPVLQKHPWIFSGAIESVNGSPEPGQTVEILGSDGDWLARGAYSPRSQIRVRIWTWNAAEAVDAALVARRLGKAIGARAPLAADPQVTAYREVFSESDGIPGLIVDRYADFRVVQFLTAGAERWREAILEALTAERDWRGIYERSDGDSRSLEGLAAHAGLVRGEAPDGPVEILEYGLKFKVDLAAGQKTGFYLDQRQNRARLKSLIRGGKMLDCFCYTGGFTLAGLSAGVDEVTAIESSPSALASAGENIALNGFSASRCEWITGDAFVELRHLRDRREEFDTIVLDPPRFAPTSAQVPKAARGYKDINLLAFKLLRPGGLLFTFSCSGGVGPELFQKIVADAALDAGAEANVIEWLGQPADHPVALSFPESRYLKGLVIRRAA
jgi:23S rRNA (cytosine1962-C5)-methyltransferase